MLSCFHCFCYFSLAKLFEQFWIWHWNLKLLCCRKKTWRELNCHRRCQWKADQREELRQLLAFQAKGGGLIAHNHSTWNPWVNEQGKCWNGLWAMKRQKKWQQGRTSPFCHKVTLKVPHTMPASVTISASNTYKDILMLKHGWGYRQHTLIYQIPTGFVTNASKISVILILLTVTHVWVGFTWNVNF